MDAGVAGFEDAQNSQCATFYGAGCALYQDLFTDLTSLGAPPSPPPPPIAPLNDPGLGTARGPAEAHLLRHGPLAQHADLAHAAGRVGRRARAVPYRKRDRRRHLQSADADGEGAEIIDATDDPLIIDACSLPEGPDQLTLCETNGYENAVRPARPFEPARTILSPC